MPLIPTFSQLTLSQTLEFTWSSCKIISSFNYLDGCAGQCRTSRFLLMVQRTCINTHPCSSKHDTFGDSFYAIENLTLRSFHATLRLLARET